MPSKKFIDIQARTITWGEKKYDLSPAYGFGTATAMPIEHPFRRFVSTVSNYEATADSLASLLGDLQRSAERDLDRLKEGNQLWGINGGQCFQIAQAEGKLRATAEQATLLLSMVPEAELAALVRE